MTSEIIDIGNRYEKSKSRIMIVKSYPKMSVDDVEPILKKGKLSFDDVVVYSFCKSEDDYCKEKKNFCSGDVLDSFKIIVSELKPKFVFFVDKILGKLLSSKLKIPCTSDEKCLAREIRKPGSKLIEDYYKKAECELKKFLEDLMKIREKIYYGVNDKLASLYKKRQLDEYFPLKKDIDDLKKDVDEFFSLIENLRVNCDVLIESLDDDIFDKMCCFILDEKVDGRGGNAKTGQIARQIQRFLRDLLENLENSEKVWKRMKEKERKTAVKSYVLLKMKEIKRTLQEKHCAIEKNVNLDISNKNACQICGAFDKLISENKMDPEKLLKWYKNALNRLKDLSKRNFSKNFGYKKENPTKKVE